MANQQRWAIRVSGIVQGVGFRPFVQRLATEHGLAGTVGNDGQGVWCVAVGQPSALAVFAAALKSQAPPLARVDSIEHQVIADGYSDAEFDRAFRISESRLEVSGSMLIPADVTTCNACIAEVFDPDDRRFRYAFTCCTDCGPRHTVVRGLPYDRERTALADFVMCKDCQSEYEDPFSRRFHAQANCCRACGPTLTLSMSPRARALVSNETEDPVELAADLLLGGAIVAVKGLGGYQLLCRANNPDVVDRLRERKYRDEKPFAVMVGSLEAARALSDLDDLSARSLTSPEAPIVLVDARLDATGISVAIAPGTGLLGLMLPATPMHHLLVERTGVPLVCTSGNRSGEPIVIADEVAFIDEIADAVLSHDRQIERRADDSVGQVVAGRFQLLRRARGFAPRGVRLLSDGPPILGVGAELKNTVCLATGTEAYLSVHLGDLENPATMVAFEATIADALQLTKLLPELVVHDMHPEYLSTKFAAGQDLAPTLAVQHHHAHLVSCLTDNAWEGQAIGVTFDGTGWGPDGTLWGGEFLVGDARVYARRAHLNTVAVPGGAKAITEPWRMAVSYLTDAFGELPDLPLFARHRDSVSTVLSLCHSQDTIQTSSVGRLFDAVAALCDVRDVINYEGQAAIGLEYLAGHSSETAGYQYHAGDLSSGEVDTAGLFRNILADLRSGTSTSLVARRFHNWMADMILKTCIGIREDADVSVVALSGGVFQNRLLVELVVPKLLEAGFSELRHSQVPANDGGISLGQVAIGRAHLRGT